MDAPHEREVESYSFLDPAALVNHLRSGYLPSGSGSWDCVLNGEVIATIGSGGITPKVPEVEYADANRLHFAYRPSTY